MMNEDWRAGLVGKCRRLEKRKRKEVWGRGELERSGQGATKPPLLGQFLCLPREGVGKCSSPCTPAEFGPLYPAPQPAQGT